MDGDFFELANGGILEALNVHALASLNSLVEQLPVNCSKKNCLLILIINIYNIIYYYHNLLYYNNYTLYS